MDFDSIYRVGRDVNERRQSGFAVHHFLNLFDNGFIFFAFGLVNAVVHIVAGNPDLRYNAAIEDPYRMKKKVVRGGSWKDVNAFIRSDARTSEYQNEQRSYIGFRCVRTQVGYNKKGR